MTPLKRRANGNELRASDELIRLVTEMSDVAIWEYDLVRDEMKRTANHDALYGLPWQETWRLPTFLDATLDEDRTRSERVIAEACSPGGPDGYEFDFRVTWPDGSVHWLWVQGRVAERDNTGAGVLVRGVLQEVTDRYRRERAFERLVQFYATLSDTNQAVVYGTDEMKLFVEICESAVRHHAADAAWIGFEEVDGVIRPMASKGEGIEGFLAHRAELIGDPTVHRLDLPTIAVRDDRPVWHRSEVSLGADEVGHAARDRGWLSGASVPLRRHGVAKGALTFYSGDPTHFDERLDTLLGEIATDVSFALDLFEEKRQQQKLREDLVVANRRINEILDQSVFGVYVLDGSNIVYVNQRAVDLLGYVEVDELVGLDFANIVGGETNLLVENEIRQFSSSGAAASEVRFSTTRPNGERVDLVATSSLGKFNGRVARIGMIQAIS